MRISLSVFFICFSLMSFSQMSNIVLNNPSFEDRPRKGGAVKGIKGWYDCGIINFRDESPPDIHPGDAWGVDLEPYEGKTYLGLVVRDNETWESVSQRLNVQNGSKAPMIGGKCYKLSMAVLRAEEYMSGSRLQLLQSNDKAQTYNYTTPVVVRIWGGRGYCDKKELLATSEPVVNSEWELIEIEFTPTKNYKVLTLEAFYELPVVVPYNGHVLIDNLSEIVQVECKE